MTWLKRVLRNWLVPEYKQFIISKQRMDSFMEEIARAQSEVQLVDKNITFSKPVVFIGSLKDCKVDVKPNIALDLTLAKVDIPAGLTVLGEKATVWNNYSANHPVAIKREET